MDGILGFAFKRAAQTHHLPLLDSLKKHGIISTRVFSFFLNPALDEANGAHSRLIFGSPDVASLVRERRQQMKLVATEKEAKALSTEVPSLVYVTLLNPDAPSLWFVPLQGVLVGGDSLGLCGVLEPCVALPDTGTSFLAIPQRRWQPFISLLTAKRPDCVLDQNQNVMCGNSGYEGLPDLTFLLGGNAFTLKPVHYMLPNNQLCVQPLLVASGDLFILGDAFLRAVHTVFDMEEKRVGFVSLESSDTIAAESTPRSLWRSFASDNLFTSEHPLLFYVLAALCLANIFFLCRSCRMSPDLCCCLRRSGYQAL
jgi:hypothetical protein